jgi:uncharacterized membrane protein YgdD (TMEM256/DUF423 family)
MHKKFLTIACVLGAVSVCLGAFAAHSLKQIFSVEELQIFETAVKYQFYHVFALFITAILYNHYPVKKMLWAGNLFITGIVLFSGSLYALCFAKNNGLNLNWLGAITPFGGVCFIVGWLLMAVTVGKKN